MIDGLMEEDIRELYEELLSLCQNEGCVLQDYRILRESFERVIRERMCAVGLLELPHTAYNIAADANCDGEITETDFILIQDSAILNNFIFNDYTPGA